MLADLAQPWQQQQEQPLAGQQAEIRQEEERQHAQQQLGQQQQQEGVQQDHPSAQQQPPPQNQQQAVGLKEEVLSRTEHQPGLPGDSQQPCNGKQGPDPTQCLLQLPPSHPEHSPSSPSPQLSQLPAGAPPPTPSQPASLPASHLNLLPPARPLQLPQPAQQPQPLQQIVPPVDTRVREVKRQRVLERFGELERRYLQLRRDQGAVQGGEAAAGQAPPPYLHQLSEVIEAATHFGRMTVLSEIQAGSGGGGGGGGQAGRAGGEGGRAGGGMVSALEFNTEDSVLASCTAQRACLWQYSQLLASSTKPPQPLLELPSRSSLTCLTWSKHQTSCLITSDAEGQVHLHDTHTQQRLSDFAAHAKRIWSVDAASSAAGRTGSGLGSTLFATGSDDYSVKLWSPSSPSAAACLDTGANVCSVRFNPWAPHYLAVGSAALAILLYDLRKAGGGSPPLARLQGHRKAVSCVRWLDSSQLVSASTDSSLRLWDNMGWGAAGGQEAPVGWGRLVRTYTGHVNERNFVGLAASEEVLAAGSETGEVCVYLKSTPTPCLCHKLCSSKPTVKHRPGSPAHFISSLTWHAGSHTLVAGNSGGDVWALDLQC
ncbi:WD40-repeat-containing domain protein [Haematococcus lacustris]